MCKREIGVSRSLALALLHLCAVGLFRYRLYRDACMALEGNYLKDLNVLGRDLSKVAIVDNSPYAYGFQVQHHMLTIFCVEKVVSHGTSWWLPFVLLNLVAPLCLWTFPLHVILCMVVEYPLCAP